MIQIGDLGCFSSRFAGSRWHLRCCERMDGLAIGVEGGGNGWSCCDLVTNGDGWWWRVAREKRGEIPHPRLAFASQGGGVVRRLL